MYYHRFKSDDTDTYDSRFQEPARLDPTRPRCPLPIARHEYPRTSRTSFCDGLPTRLRSLRITSSVRLQLHRRPLWRWSAPGPVSSWLSGCDSRDCMLSSISFASATSLHLAKIRNTKPQKHQACKRDPGDAAVEGAIVSLNNTDVVSSIQRHDKVNNNAQAGISSQETFHVPNSSNSWQACY